jgi:hypothetical protein
LTDRPTTACSVADVIVMVKPSSIAGWVSSTLTAIGYSC